MLRVIFDDFDGRSDPYRGQIRVLNGLALVPRVPERVEVEPSMCGEPHVDCTSCLVPVALALDATKILAIGPPLSTMSREPYDF